MRVLILILFWVFALCDELKIATYNVENLFDGKNNGNEYLEFRIGGKNSQWNENKYIEKLGEISKVLEELNADIISLNEIENAEVLKELAEISGYKYHKFATTKNAPIGLGFLSKFPIISEMREVIFGVKTRPIFMIEVDLGGESLKLFTAHFPAYRNGDEVRKKVARHMLKLANENYKKSIIMGDLNSKFNGKRKNNKSPNSEFLLIDLIKENKFYNLWQDYNGKMRSHSGGNIDQIMISSDLLEGKKIKYKQGSFNVLHNNASDHNPIYATIEYNGTLQREVVEKKELAPSFKTR